MNRRDFVTHSLAAGSVLTAAIGTSGLARAASVDPTPFNLNYAPRLNQFRHHVGNDPIENIKFMYDQGFRAVFDNGLMRKPPELQEKIGDALKERGMALGPFVIYMEHMEKETLVRNDADIRRTLADHIKAAVETAERAGGQSALIVPGRYDQRVDWGYQTANVIDNLRYVSELCEASGLVIVLEPLNKRDHPGLFLTTIPQTYAICRAVNHPCCKIVNDLYHQQITEGDLIPNIDSAWDEIACFHLGDTPGRQEPGTGEINYRNIFQHLYHKGYQGVLCMEHRASLDGKEGEQAIIQAYRECDSFETRRS